MKKRYELVLGFIISVFVFTCGYAQKKSENSGFTYKKGYYYLVNHKGKKIKVDPFTYAEPFSEDLALVEKDFKFGYIDKTGKLVIDYQYYNAGSFSNGKAYACKDGKYGYINKKGDFVIQPKFESALDFVGDYAKVRKLNTDTAKYGKSIWVYGLIDSSGKVISNQYYSSLTYFEGNNYFRATIRGAMYRVTSDGDISIIEKHEDDKVIKDGVYYITEEMPKYPGGELRLKQFIISNVRYPLSAQKKGITGKCYIQFMVDTNGDVCDVYPVSQESVLLEKESVRVVKGLEKWKPGVQNNIKVSVCYTVPINFVLN